MTHISMCVYCTDKIFTYNNGNVMILSVLMHTNQKEVSDKEQVPF